MLYVISDTHKADDCPGKDPGLMKEFATRFSEDNSLDCNSIRYFCLVSNEGNQKITSASIFREELSYSYYD
jgi:hypothetical protein